MQISINIINENSLLFKIFEFYSGYCSEKSASKALAEYKKIPNTEIQEFLGKCLTLMQAGHSPEYIQVVMQISYEKIDKINLDQNMLQA